MAVHKLGHPLKKGVVESQKLTNNNNSNFGGKVVHYADKGVKKGIFSS